MTHTKDQRKATITEGGASRDALTRPWAQMVDGKQHEPVLGTLNGRPVEFRVTSGASKFYAYFTALGHVWYVDTGSGLLSAGASIEFNGERWSPP